MNQTTSQKQKQTGLLESILILDIILPFLIWLMLLGAGPDFAGAGMLVSLLVVPLWFLFCIPIIVLAACGIKSAKHMATPAMQKLRLILSIIAIVERLAIASTLLYFILV